jgi:hypothetical protein
MKLVHNIISFKHFSTALKLSNKKSGDFLNFSLLYLCTSSSAWGNRILDIMLLIILSLPVLHIFFRAVACESFKQENVCLPICNSYLSIVYNNFPGE